MSRLLLMAVLALPSVACFAGAAVVARSGHDGWGWLIFIGFLVNPLMNESASERLLRAAQAGEAGTATTPKIGVVHEHAVSAADAPKS